MSGTAKELVCKDCGRHFIATSELLNKHPTRCRVCYTARREDARRKREEADNQKYNESGRKSHELFEKRVQAYQIVPMSDIHPSDCTLYVIGNGFDLMHRVPSSYSCFRDSLGKNNPLRVALEMMLVSDDIWADFEGALGHLNTELLASRGIVDMWLDNYGFYTDEDAGASEYYMAIESAVGPLSAVTDRLQPTFRRWVESLAVGTDDRPLKELIRPGGKALCFNYTEFVETLYGANDVCYIHGSRQNKGQRLVLGHVPGSQSILRERHREPNTYRQAAIDNAQEEVLRLIDEHDRELTKHCDEIIRENRAFFDGLGDIDQVIVIGHSLSRVDWDYFRELNQSAPSAYWHFGVFGLRELDNLDDMVERLGIKRFDIFRTDGIRTRPIALVEDNVVRRKTKAREFNSGGYLIRVESTRMEVLCGDDVQYEIMLPNDVKKALILDDNLFVVLSDLGGNVLLFRKSGCGWGFVDQLKAPRHQRLLNSRLRHVYSSGEAIAFVYNNRIRTYSLITGELLRNQQVRKARDLVLPGADVIEAFIRV